MMDSGYDDNIMFCNNHNVMPLYFIELNALSLNIYFTAKKLSQIVVCAQANATETRPRRILQFPG